jgi:peroxiredoxin
MHKTISLRLGFLIVIILAGLAWVIYSPRLAVVDVAATKIAAPLRGYPAPDFQLQDINGFHYTLSDLQGRVVVINFWASWCTPCKIEMPAFQEAANEYDIEDVIILGVNVSNQDDINNAISFLEDQQITFPILLDQTGSVSNIYDVYSMPTTFFVDAEGIIRKVMIGGPISKAAIKSEISQLMDY